MNQVEAKRVLSAYRPGQEGADEPDVVAALELTRREPALEQWWRQQQVFHVTIKQGLAGIPIPNDLRGRIRVRPVIVSFPWWRRPSVWAAAAIVLLVGLVLLPQKSGSDVPFETFRSRMVRTVLRQYRMDIQTNDMTGVRQFLAGNKAPADYVLPPALAQLTPLGAGVLSWQGSRVSMVCLNSKAGGTLFLFVADQSTMSRPPGGARDYARINKLTTVSWTEGKNVYILAGEAPLQSLD